MSKDNKDNKNNISLNSDTTNNNSSSGSGLREIHKNPNVGNEQFFTSFQKYVPNSSSTQVLNNEQKQSQQHENVKKDCTHSGDGSGGNGLKELHKNPNVGNEQFFTSFQKYVPKVQGGEESDLKEIHKNPNVGNEQFFTKSDSVDSTNNK